MKKIFWKFYRYENAKLIASYPFAVNIMDVDTKTTYYRFPFTGIYILKSSP